MGRFELFLEQNGSPFSVLEVAPATVINAATVLLRVANTTVLDYETTQSLEFQVLP